MSADITLVNLNLLYVRYVDAIDKELHLPLGCLYLTKALEDAGFEVDFRDYQLNDYEDPFEIGNIIDFLSGSAHIVGFSCMANLLPFVIMAMKAFKEAHPDKFLVLGGVGAKSVEEKIMQRFPWVDCIAIGEGERTGPELVRAVKNGLQLKDVPGLMIRLESGEICRTPPRERIIDLDEIPFPAFHKVDLKKYQGYGMMTTRGCPYPCTFCSVAPIWDHKSTFRSVGNIIDEMELLKRKADVNLFLFQDEFFVCNKERVMSFCAELSRRKLDVFWKAFGRVDLTDSEMMKAMADTGCVELRFGVESGSDRILERVKKGFNSRQALERISEAIGIFRRVDAFYMWGFPFETMDDFHQTVFQMVMLRMSGARILPSLLCILPQTELYREEKANYPIDFCPELFPEYMITGHEVSRLSRFSIDERHSSKYDFIRDNSDIFPGFFHMDLKNNVMPKLAVLKKFGFYPGDFEGDEMLTGQTDSCGAHSPKSPLPHEIATGSMLPAGKDQSSRRL